jgi:hypothetical protein
MAAHGHQGLNVVVLGADHEVVLGRVRSDLQTLGSSLAFCPLACTSRSLNSGAW